MKKSYIIPVTEILEFDADVVIKTSQVRIINNDDYTEDDYDVH